MRLLQTANLFLDDVKTFYFFIFVPFFVFNVFYFFESFYYKIFNCNYNSILMIFFAIASFATLTDAQCNGSYTIMQEV